jgi:hypothetical protein
MKRFPYFENFEDEDYDFGQDLFSSGYNKKKEEEEEVHPWERDYDDVFYSSGKQEEEEEEEEEVIADDDEDYTVDYVQHLLKEAGLQSFVTTAGKDIEALVLLEKQYPFSKFLEIVESLRSISYLEEFRDYTTNFSIFKSTKDQPLIIFELNYKPYSKTTYYSTTTKKK